MSQKRTHTPAYHQQPHLLFQLILDDFLIAFQEVFALREIQDKLENMAVNGCSKQKLHQVLKALSSSIHLLSGNPQAGAPLFSWISEDGLLTRIKKHCSWLSSCVAEEVEEPLHLHHQANRAWLSSMQTLELTKVLLRQSVDEIWDSEEYESLCRCLVRITTHMGRFSRLLTRFFAHFHQNEDVLYYLMRHSNEFNTIFGPNYVEKLLQKLFPKGDTDAEEFLMRRFQKRGFEEHIPIIKAQFAHRG